MLILMIGIATAGGVVVFPNPWWTSTALLYTVNYSGAKIIFVDGTRAERFKPSIRGNGLILIGVGDVEETLDLAYSKLLRITDKKVWPEHGLQSDDDFAIMYSSGTTGQPKGVLLKHRGIISAVFS